MKNLFLVVGAAALLSACGDAGAAQRKLVTVDYIVADSPIIRTEACYLRLRPMNQPNAAPTVRRFMKGGDLTSIRGGFDLCSVSKIGDKISRTESHIVPHS